MLSSSRKINILFLMIRMEMGGSERLVYNLVRNLDRSIFNPTIGWFYGEQALKDFSELGVTLCHIPKPRSVDINAMRTIGRLIKEKNIDIVNPHHFMPLVYAFYGAKISQSAKLIGTFHSKWEIDELPLKWRIAGRALLKRVDGVVGVSNEIAESAHTVLGAAPSRTFTLVNGVDVELFCRKKPRTGLRAELGLKESDRVIGVIANMKKVKNHVFLLKAFREVAREVPDVKLLFIGRGFNDPDNTEREIRDFIEQNRLTGKVLLLGARSDIPDLLNSMDVYCLPSLHEGLPISMIEAMAAGLPVLGTNVPGIRDVIVQGRNGFLVSLHEVQALKKALLALLKNEALRREYGQMSRLLAVERYSLKHRINEYQELFLSMHNKARKDSPSTPEVS